MAKPKNAKQEKQKKSRPVKPVSEKRQTPAAQESRNRKESGRAGMLIEVVKTPELRDGTDKQLCFSAIAEGKGKITVREYLALASPKCRKPANANWYLRSFLTEHVVSLVEPDQVKLGRQPI